MTITCPIASACQSHPNQPAVVVDDTSVSYLELNERICATEQALKELGISNGDHVGIRLRAGLDLPVILWALFRRGAVAVLLSDRDPEKRIAENCAATGCLLVISDLPISLQVPVVAPAAIRQRRSGSDVGASRSLLLDAPATIVFTSGSESRPKAVVHSLENHWFSAEGSQSVIPVSSKTRWAVVIPTHHVGGLSIFFRCFLNGGTVVIVDRDQRTPSGLAAHDATHVSAVPTQLIDWLGRPDRALLLKLDTILVGGAATATRFRLEAVKAALPVRFTYGSTEMASQIATTDLGETDWSMGDAGRILPYREVRIERGEIFVRGKTRFLGYWLDGELRRPFDDEGWFGTGDMGRLDGDRLILIGRRDTRFVSGGENIYPEEIEEAIVSSGLAERAIVVPVEDERFGARPIAYVRPLCSIEALRTSLRSTLPGYKIPDRILPLPEGMDGSKSDRRKLAGLSV